MKSVGEYPGGSVENRAMHRGMSADKLQHFSFLQIQNLWRVDDLHFLEIEQKFDAEAATEIGADVRAKTNGANGNLCSDSWILACYAEKL